MSMQLEPSVKSALFVPGSRPERFDKAIATGADRIIVDFEDAVEETMKCQARENLGIYLTANPRLRVVVRINASDHPEHQNDLDFCSRFPEISAILLPKAESAGQVEHVASTGKRVWPLIESAKGLEFLAVIASGAGVERLTFGALDLALDLGLRAQSASASRIFDQVRYQILLATARARLARPLDTVFPAFSDLEGLAAFAQDALGMGFGGMLCIHPSQVQVANRVFEPTPEEVEWARQVVDAARSAPGAFRLNGKMVDAPVIAAAQRLLQAL
ncbi:CoA ester lyase [Pseudomonas sp. dw_358]|uniref:HpcH/HpaI aldolase/citrate lyase family protein n=1 Tax=Pseudomonas sp. dw_358 TaxID=2720083 RepID=UPI001BD544FD|nr:CoA ester lyase [Pseudomonas sp. dw_358]